MKDFTQFQEKLYSEHKQKPNNVPQKQYNREDLKHKKVKATKPITI